MLSYFWIGYLASKSVLSLNLALIIFLLAVLANVAYCAAYVVDVFAQAFGYRALWRKYRWTLFAAVITRFVAMGIFSPN